MDRLCIFITVVLIFALSYQVQAGIGDCITQYKPTLNQKVQEIIDTLIGAELAKQDPNTLVVTVEDAKLSQMLTALCETQSIKDAMLQIQNILGQCPMILLAGDTKLNLLHIKGLVFTQIFGAFTSVDNFCNCQSKLPMAWDLKEAVLTHTDNTSMFQTIADAGKICSDATKTAITMIASFTPTDECGSPITNMAGFDNSEKKAKLQNLKQFVDNHCANFAADKWTCVTEQDSMGDVGNCITSWALQQSQNTIACAKRICVTTFIGGPCDTTADLYIAAVNLETASALLDTGSTCSDLDIACVTYAGVNSINQAVQTIFGGLAQYVDMTTGTPVIADSDIPAIFSELCTNANLKAAMVQIQTAATNCRFTTLLASQLGSLTIKGIAFGQFFQMFPDVDTFCQCSRALPAAWALRVDTTDRKYTDDNAAFRNIADVGKICSPPWKDLVVADVCKATLRIQAGYTDETSGDFDKLYDIAEECGTTAANDWTCMKGVATNSEFKSCISVEGSKVGDSARCGRWDCVEKHMNTCSDDARKLYAKAVNAENTNAIKMDRAVCDGASVLQISLLALTACFILLRL